MLTVYPQLSPRIEAVERKNDRLYLTVKAYRCRLEPKTGNILRVTVTKREDFLEEEQVQKPGVVFRQVESAWDYREAQGEILLQMSGLQVRIDRDTGSFTYCDGNGGVLLREKAAGSKQLEEFMTYRLADEGKLEKEIIQTADGKKEVVRSADRVEAGKMYHTRLHLDWQPEERLYGLGQQEEGFCNLRGRTVYVHQANRKIAIPLLVSSLGYGILMDTYSPMIFQDTEYGSYLYTEADPEMDFYLIVGQDPDDVIRGYRLLTGKAAMLPRWAYGYLQSQERYETQEEILRIAAEYRKRELGLDAVVLDWCSWEDGKWGQKSLDATRFPDAEAMTRELHDENVHFMISIWPNMDQNCEDYREFSERGLLLPGSNVYNAYEEAGRSLYWDQINRNLFSRGIDAWWCDSSEPYTPEWNHLVRPEPARMYEEFCREAAEHIPAWLTNAFCLYHARSIYEGQRSAGKKRVCNLTRSAYTGQQRYGTIMWSGDTGASWKTLRRQIAAGLSFSASGLPYWTADIGAFFVKTGEHWYWDGEYPEAADDPAYRELFVRWFQWGCFLPVFRGHGTDCRRELWEFGEEGECFYDALAQTNRLRYRLMPYIYSMAGKVWREDASFIRMLAFAFPSDREAAECTDQYLFGDSMMVCPVTEPMLDPDGSGKAQTRKVYLPAGCGWYDFWTEKYYDGGRWILADAPLEKIPVFVREGAVIPMAEFTGSTAGCREISVKIYPGRDAEFALYEDAGDGYGYESGEYSVRKLLWKDDAQELVVEQEHGSAEAEYVAEIAGWKAAGSK